MKGMIQASSLTVLVGLLIAGCSSTGNDTASYEVAKYESRCAVQASTIGEGSDKPKSAKPLSVQSPKYPRFAAANRIEGYVKLEFDISKQGKPSNINVIESYPAGVFDQQAIQALRGWQYESIARDCNEVHLDFKIG